MHKKLVLAIQLLVGALIIWGVVTAVAPLVLGEWSLLAQLAYFIVVVGEVIVAPVPGGVLAYVLAASWGFWKTWPIHYAGNVVGAISVFFLARKYGQVFISRFTRTDKYKKLDRFVQSSPWILLLVYSFPVFPIDLISIAAGLSNISFKRFASTIVVGLLLYTAIVSFVGAFIGQYVPFIETIGLIVLGLAFTVLIGYVAYILITEK